MGTCRLASQRRWIVGWAGAGLGCATLLTGCDSAASSRAATPAASAAPTTRNVLLVSFDTTRADHLGCYGATKARTPNVDKFASQSVRFESCFASTPETLPSHATMLTGQYPFVHGARANGVYKLAESRTSVAELLRDAGYRAHAEVSALVLNAKYGLQQGFDSFGDLDEPPPPTDVVAKPRLTVGFVERKAEEISERGIKLLRECVVAGKPFFLFLHYFDPHQPYLAPEPYKSQFPEDGYAAEIAYADAQFGRLMRALDEMGLAEDTLVILTADHGEGLQEHEEPTHGFFVYDSTLRVPLIVRMPGVAPGVARSPVRLLDIAPTVLEYAGLPIPATMQGESLSLLLRDPQAASERPCYSENLGPQLTHGYAMLRALHDGGWKYIHASRPELYDLAADPGELRNLAPNEPQRVQRMRDALRRIIETAPEVDADDTRLSPDADERARLESLGYIGGVGESEADAASELERFEPVGRNPMEHAEEMRCMIAAKGALNNGNTVLAERFLRRLLELEPDNALGLCTLGQTLIVGERYDEARDALRRAIALKPDQCEAYRLLGTLRAMDAEYELAEGRYREALQCNPADHASRIKLARVLGVMGRVDECMKEWQRLVEEAPEVASYEMLYGQALLDVKRYPQAIEHLKAAIKLDGSLNQARVKLAEALEASGDYAAAESTLKRLLEVAGDVGQSHVELAAYFERRGAWGRAIETLRKARELLPNDLDVNVNLAWYLSICPEPELRNGALALDLAQWVNKATGDKNPVALDTLAVALAENGRFEDARRVATRALERAAGLKDVRERIQRHMSYIELDQPVPGP